MNVLYVLTKDGSFNKRTNPVEYVAQQTTCSFGMITHKSKQMFVIWFISQSDDLVHESHLKKDFSPSGLYFTPIKVDEGGFKDSKTIHFFDNFSVVP